MSAEVLLQTEHMSSRGAGAEERVVDFEEGCILRVEGEDGDQVSVHPPQSGVEMKKMGCSTPCSGPAPFQDA